MIDELLGRINKYRERVTEARILQYKDMPDDDDWDEDPEEETRTGGNDRGREPEEIPEEIFFDETEEIIPGHPFDSREYYGIYTGPATSPRRYSVSPQNPWYFEIDGVVFSRETGLLILFPPGRGGRYEFPDDERVTGIGDQAFAANILLKEIILNNRVRYIGDHAFAQCLYIKEIDLPRGVEFVGDGAFMDCRSLTKVSLNCLMKEIPDRLFRNNSVLESVILPEGIESVGFAAFSGCSKLTDLMLPTALKTIGSDAFRDCRSMRAFSAEHVEEFRAFCFRGCTNLNRFFFGPDTRRIGRGIFLDAGSLEQIHFSCSPDFTAAPDALPENVEYILDTEAYLATARPYSNWLLFSLAIRNLAEGDPVPSSVFFAAMNTVKRNRTKLYDWFLSEPDVLDLVIREEIPDCDDCLRMIRKAEDPGTAEKIRAYMNSRFSRMKIINTMEKQEAEEKKKLEAERKARQLQEEMRKQEERKVCEIQDEMNKQRKEIQERLPGGKDISIEDLNLSVRAYNCLKRTGIRMLSELALMTKEDYRRVRNLGMKSMNEVIEKDESITGITVPEDRDDRPGNFSMTHWLEISWETDRRDDPEEDDLPGFDLSGLL